MIEMHKWSFSMPEPKGVQVYSRQGIGDR